jgi:SAM-dependent methyltransferase
MTAPPGLLERNRNRIDRELASSPRRELFSPAMRGLYRTLLPRIARHATGACLDAGCGTMPFRRDLEAVVGEYHSLDVERRAPDVQFVADLRDMGMIDDASYDTVLSSEVLEHIPEPERAIAEVFRILRPGGKFLLTVPFLVRLHEEPADYYRYTQHGLRFLLERAGFDVVDIAPTGSVMSFLGHQISTVAVCGTYHLPGIRHLVFWANALLCVFPCQLLDRLSGLSHKFPLGYVVVAAKP